MENEKNKWLKLDKPLWFWSWNKETLKLDTELSLSQNEVEQKRKDENISKEQFKELAEKHNEKFFYYETLKKELEVNFNSLYGYDLIREGLVLKLQNGEKVLFGDCDSTGHVDMEDHDSEYDSLCEYPIVEFYLIDLESL